MYQFSVKLIILSPIVFRRDVEYRSWPGERSSAIHTDESVEEKISLSDRFGLWIGFHNLNQDKYLKIIKSYCNFYMIEFNKETEEEAKKWSIQRGNRTGRTAWQFILKIASEKNLKLKF